MIAALAAALAVWRVELLAPGVPMVGNLWLLYQPLFESATRQLQSGRLPLWSAEMSMGMPLAADPQAGVWAPLHALFRLFPFSAALRLNLMLGVLLLAAGGYLLARRLGGRRLSCALAGALAAGNGFAFFHAPLIAHFDSLVLMPFVLLFWISGRGVWAGLALALQLAAGHPFFAYMTAAACLVLWPPRPWVALFGAAATTAGAGAFVTLGALTLFAGSDRSHAMSAEATYVFTLGPDALWRMLSTPWWNRWAQYYVSDPTITSFYIGVPALLLSAAGAWRAYLPRWSVLAALALLMTLGPFFPLYPTLLKFLPGLAYFRYPAQWGGLAALAAAVLAAHGVDALSSRARVAAFLLVTMDLAVFCSTLPHPRAPSGLMTARPVTLARMGLEPGTRLAHTPGFFRAQTDGGRSPEEWRARLEALAPSRGTLFGLGELSSYSIAAPTQARRRVARAFAERDGKTLAALGAAYVVEDAGGGASRLVRLPPSSAPAPTAWAPGWRAFANGAEVEAFDDDGLRGARAPAGDAVTFVYDPAYARWGAALCVLALAALAAAGLRALSRCVILSRDARTLPGV